MVTVRLYVDCNLFQIRQPALLMLYIFNIELWGFNVHLFKSSLSRNFRVNKEKVVHKNVSQVVIEKKMKKSRKLFKTLCDLE